MASRRAIKMRASQKRHSGRSDESVFSFLSTVRSAILAAALTLTLFLLSSAPAFSQSCSMCYSTAKATSKDGQRAISKGVLVLLLPPLTFMTLGVALAFRYSRKRDLEQNSSSDAR